MVMLPDDPSLVVPEENLNAPLTPEFPAFGVLIAIAPVDLAVLPPLRKFR